MRRDRRCPFLNLVRPHAAIASYIGRVAEDEPEFLLDFVPALQRRPPLANGASERVADIS